MHSMAPTATVISRESRNCMRPSVVNTGANRNRCNRPFSLQNRVHGFAGGKDLGAPVTGHASAAATSDRAGNRSVPSAPMYG
jgi:hypothetical protein